MSDIFQDLQLPLIREASVHEQKMLKAMFSRDKTVDATVMASTRVGLFASQCKKFEADYSSCSLLDLEVQWFKLGSWKTAIERFMDETCKTEEDRAGLLRKFADAAQNSLRDVPKMQEVPVDGPRAREQEIDADAQELALAFNNIPALFAWAGDFKALALHKLIDVVPQQVMDFETGVLSKCRTCFTGIDSSAVGVQRSTSDDSGTSLPFQRARATYQSVMSELKVHMDERLEALEQERNLAGCEERAEEDLADLIRVAKEVSDLFSTAEIDGQTTRVACETTQQEWKSRGVKQPCQSALTLATTVHERVELLKSSCRKRHGQRAWPDKNRQLGQLKNMMDEVMRDIAKNADMDDLQCIVQLCGLLQVLEETEMVFKEHPPVGHEEEDEKIVDISGLLTITSWMFQQNLKSGSRWRFTQADGTRLTGQPLHGTKNFSKQQQSG